MKKTTQWKHNSKMHDPLYPEYLEGCSEWAQEWDVKYNAEKKKQTCYIEHDLKQLCAGGKKKKRL